MSQKEVTIMSEANSVQTTCSNCGEACPLTRLQNAKYAMICQACFDKLPTDQRHDRLVTESAPVPVANGRITPEQVLVIVDVGGSYQYGQHAIRLFLRMLAKQMEQDAAEMAELKRERIEVLKASDMCETMSGVAQQLRDLQKTVRYANGRADKLQARVTELKQALERNREVS